LRYPLQGVPGVAEVASIGGFVKEYQVVLKARAVVGLRPAGRADRDGGAAVRTTTWAARSSSAARTSTWSAAAAYLHGLTDLAKVPVGVDKETGTPVMLSDLATLQVAGAERRGIGEWDGQGEAVSGIVIARYGAKRLPGGPRCQRRSWRSWKRPAAGRRDQDRLRPLAAHRAIHSHAEAHADRGNDRRGLVCILFLLHARSELVAIFVVPTSVLASLLLMHLLASARTS